MSAAEPPPAVVVKDAPPAATGFGICPDLTCGMDAAEWVRAQRDEW